ncbi:MAG: lysophospholipid acyltransferase family protein [Pseudomonadota bacterium]
MTTNADRAPRVGASDRSARGAKARLEGASPSGAVSPSASPGDAPPGDAYKDTALKSRQTAPPARPSVRFGSIVKKIAAAPAVTTAASALITAYIRLVHATCRWRLIGWENFENAEASEKGYILVFWHDRLLMAPTRRPDSKRPVYMLISSHRDGEIIANAVKPFGISFIRGSKANARKKFKEKSGAPALMQMVAALKEGAIVGVTPDGPRGPRREAQAGVAKLSAMAGAPILPAAYATSRGRSLSTWDRFWVPWPFSRGVFSVGPAIDPPDARDAFKDAQAMAGYAATIGEALQTVTDAAEDAVNRSPPST